LPESPAERLKLIDKNHPEIAVKRQCELLNANRSMVYYEPKPVSEFDLMLLKRIDKIYTAYPFYGAPRITKHLNIIENIAINHKKSERLMAEMSIQAIYPKTKWNLSQEDKQQRKFTNLLK